MTGHMLPVILVFITLISRSRAFLHFCCIHSSFPLYPHSFQKRQPPPPPSCIKKAYTSLPLCVIPERCDKESYSSPSPLLDSNDDIFETTFSPYEKQVDLFVSQQFVSNAPTALSKDLKWIKSHDSGRKNAPPEEILATLLLVSLATFGLVQIWESLLMQFEWMQAWRYTWPLIGGVYLVQGVSTIIKRSYTDMTTYSQKFSLDHDITCIFSGQDEPWWCQAATALAGIGLMIGGAADAWLPVYVTGPNLVTTAGLGPDSAAFLGLWQVVRLAKQSTSNSSNSSSTNNTTVSLANAILLSQLYILAAGSIDDVTC